MTWLDWVIGGTQAALLIYGLYQFVLSLAAFGHRPTAPEPSGRVHRFALVTAAHNEEQVIVPHVENLLRLDYPRECYQVFVIADNCTDATARLARQAGARVLERHNLRQRGKGYALEWFFDQFLRGVGQEFDAVCMFDADNLVDPKFLQYMNSELNRGHRCIQGYIDSKNPLDSWVSCCYSIAFWSTNRLYQLARHRLGLSAYLGGTGMCISTELLRQFGWRSYSLTEDLEFTVRLVDAGQRVWWCHDARVYDEKPVTFGPTWRQRLRWLQGHWQLCCRHALPLLASGVWRGSWQRVDTALHLLHPPVLIASGALLVLDLANRVLGHLGTPLYHAPWTAWLPAWFWSCLALAGYCWPVISLWLERVPVAVFPYYLVYIPYAMSWLPIAVIGWFRRHNLDWSHTRHTRAVRLEELTVAGSPLRVQGSGCGADRSRTTCPGAERRATGAAR